MIVNIPFQKGATYHVYNRANGTDRMFCNAGNYFYFMRKYHEYMGQLWDTHVYCLMPTHFHLLISVKPQQGDEDDLARKCSQAFSNFANSYAQAFNKQQFRHGSLFSPNFRRKEVDSIEYLKTAICYIHCNPVKDGLVSAPDDWAHSSYNAIADGPNTIFGLDPVISVFGSRSEFLRQHGDFDRSFDLDLTLKKAS